jgi:hypothetical protein
MSITNITDIPRRTISRAISIQLKAHFYIHLRIVLTIPCRLLREIQVVISMLSSKYILIAGCSQTDLIYAPHSE